MELQLKLFFEYAIAQVRWAAYSTSMGGCMWNSQTLISYPIIGKLIQLAFRIYLFFN